jgi:Flp pilus assembly protein TadG
MRSPSLRRGESGMAMVETVIVLPLVLMLLFATLEFGVVFGRWQVLGNAAREGARLGVVFRNPATCTAAGVEAEIDAAVASYASALGMSVSAGDVSVTGACIPGPLSVRVSHVHDFLFLDDFAPSVSPTLTIVGRSTMRNE